MALLALNIGPVQTFIASARTTRDLWCGSYVLSWMTQAALLHLHGQGLGGGIIFPVIAPASPPNTYACLPNLFLAEVPDERANAIAEKACAAAKGAWQAIARDVEAALVSAWKISPAVDLLGWRTQVDHFFDVRAIVLPEDGRGYAERYKEIGRRLAADKLLRHVEPAEDPEESRPKCFIDGTHAQMGPRGSLAELAAWWAARSGEKSAVGGTRVGKSERLSAVSLVKRYAWACSLQEQLEADRDDLRFPDTATIAARLWLDRHLPRWQEYGRKPGQGVPWSGQWLHWPIGPDAKLVPPDEEDPRPPHMIETQIVAARGKATRKPPTYYAALMMDGDRMGERIRRLTRGPGDAAARHRDLSRWMADFAGRDVPAVINAAQGVLIYSGGDDVLALLPVRNVFKAADDLRRSFARRIEDGSTGLPATMSAGIVLAHYKSDLRDTLDQARAAERLAKADGRNRLCLAVLKRSGEQARATLDWEALATFGQLVDWHDEEDEAGNTKTPMSDRWAYRLGREATRLRLLHAMPAVIESEVRRTIGRGGKADAAGEYEQAAVDLWGRVSAPLAGRGAEAFEKGAQDFAFLVRASSFVTRGREERS